jgi:hypothetical protein
MNERTELHGARIAMQDVLVPGIVKVASAGAEFHQDSIRWTAHAFCVRIRGLQDLLE